MGINRQDKRRISESVEEVDQLLDDMAVVSRQMKEGKKLYSEEELEEAVNNATTSAVDGMLCNLTDQEMEDWFFKNGGGDEEDPDSPGESDDPDNPDNPEGPTEGGSASSSGEAGGAAAVEDEEEP